MNAVFAGSCESVLAYHATYRSAGTSRSARNDPLRARYGIRGVVPNQDPDSIAGTAGYGAWAQRYLEENGEWVWSDQEGKSVVERNGFACSPLAIANDLVCQHQDSPGWGPIHQVGQLIRGAGSHPERAPYLNEHEAELHLEFD